MDIAKIMCMNKGGGETSYAKNSLLQRKIIFDSKQITDWAIESMISSCAASQQSIAIADLGCSSGPNTLLMISHTLNLLYSKCKRFGDPLPEVLVFLNDLFSNDFNNIFKSLPDFHRRLLADNGGEVGPCFVSGMPGSFYGRLFPKNSINFLRSSSSLHWLSKVPDGLEGDDERMKMNKGNLYVSPTSSESVVEAYSAQFRNDFSAFMKSRSEETISGGRMVLTFVGRKSVDPVTAESSHLWELLAEALSNLASQGAIEKEKIDSFNAPYYAPCMEEVKMETEKEGSFIIDQFEEFEVDWDGSGAEAESGLKILSRGERVAKTVRAVAETMLEAHFGGNIMDDLFQRFGDIVEDYFSTNRIKSTNFVVSFVKK